MSEDTSHMDNFDQVQGGCVIILSGPSGVGKTTISKMLFNEMVQQHEHQRTVLFDADSFTNPGTNINEGRILTYQYDNQGTDWSVHGMLAASCRMAALGKRVILHCILLPEFRTLALYRTQYGENFTIHYIGLRADIIQCAERVYARESPSATTTISEHYISRKRFYDRIIPAFDGINTAQIPPGINSIVIDANEQVQIVFKRVSRKMIHHQGGRGNSTS